MNNLRKLLAYTFHLYYMTHLFHWNVKGNNFVGLHYLFAEQYKNLWEAVDVIAEKIRQRGELIDYSLSDMEQNSFAVQYMGIENQVDMVKQLLRHNILMVEKLNEMIETTDDLVDQNLFIERRAYHDLQVWKLSSILE